MGKMKLHTRLFSTALLAGLALSATAQDAVTAKATLSKPVRLGEEKTDYRSKPFMEINTWLEANEVQGYFCPMRFDLSSVKEAASKGKIVKSAKLRLTQYGANNGLKVGVRAFSPKWNASSTTADLKTLVKAVLENETVAKGDITFGDVMTNVYKATSETTYAISNYQGYVDVTDYVKANAATDELNVVLSRYDYNTGSNYKASIWTSNVNATNKGDIKDNWDNVLKAFNMTAEEFIASVTPTIEVELATPNNVGATTTTAIADCYVRTNATDKAHDNEQVETWNKSDSKSYGLMAFDVPEAVSFKDITTVSSATLRLVTRKVANGSYKNMSVYAYGNDFTEKATYTNETSHVEETLKSKAITTFDMVGQAGKAFSDSGLNDNNKNLEAWTNNVDITEYVKGNAPSRLNLMFIPTTENANANLQIYSRTVTAKKLNGETEHSADDLVPQLTVNYTVSYKLAISEAGAATLCLPYEAQIPSGVKAYKLTGVANGVVATEELSNTIAPNTPVLVMAEQGNYDFAAADPNVKSATATSGVLTGAYAETTVPKGSYILTYKDSKLAFRKADGTTNKVKAYRAYLTSNSSDGAKTLTLDLDGSTTAIRAAKAESVASGKSYNLAGQAAERGLIIKNGKKYTVK